MNKNISLYIHVPFCVQKCNYCNFYSLVDKSYFDVYVDAVCKEIDKYKTDLCDRVVATVYFGGGTPTLIGSDGLGKILSYIKKSCNLYDDAEISLEANPNSVTLSMLKELSAHGFNRISFGAQSADSYELKLLGRKHNNRQVAQAIFWSREASFSNTSIDLMIGVPSQTMSSLDKSIDFVTSLEPNHISAYMLKLEPGTPMSKARHTLDIPDDDDQADFYIHAVDSLANKGYGQYEISNFSKHGAECRHNLVYWNAQEYLGIGPSAHSFIGEKRFYYKNDLKDFIKGSKDTNKHTVVSDTGGDIEEYIMLRLRLSEGVLYKNLEKNFSFTYEHQNRLEKKAESLQKYGLCISDNDGIKLTTKGFLLSNYCTSFLLGSDL